MKIIMVHRLAPAGEGGVESKKIFSALTIIHRSYAHKFAISDMRKICCKG